MESVAVVITVFLALVFAYAASSGALKRADVTAPMAFVGAGALLSLWVPTISGASAGALTRLTELTLALILFHDAAQVRPRQITADRGLMSRLLLIGLPLTMVAGWLAGSVLFPGMNGMMLLLLAAAAAPTDAGLGAATVLNPVVPVRVRRMLNVESGLNDGLSTPIVLFAIAALAGDEGLGPVESLSSALTDLAIGVLVGTVIGAGAGLLLGRSRRAGTSTRHSRPLAVLALPIIAFFAAELASGNSFVAAFVAGTAFAGSARWLEAEESTLELTEALSEPLGFAVWLAFGFLAVPLLVSNVGWREVAFALLALTVLRMLPVALALAGTGLRAPTVAFIGWFGPRGLASVVFALFAVEELDVDTDLTTAVTALCLIVLFSIVAHGMSADPWSRRYGAWVERVQPEEEVKGSTEPSRSRGAARRDTPVHRQ
ncbi:MAG: cation:proton antiporter [Ornithinibacter sp.]